LNQGNVAEGEGNYRAAKTDGGYNVLMPDGRVMLRCSDEASARHYAVMLDEAYKLGYKAGFRDGLKD
jgi:hypothetical protein